MKITKAQLKQIIKEELDQAIVEEPELAETYNFKIYQEGQYRESPITTLGYVANVPMSMIDSESYISFKATHKDPERFLSLKREALEQFGFTGSMVYSSQIEKIPEFVQVSATVNLRTGEVASVGKPPKFIDAQG